MSFYVVLLLVRHQCGIVGEDQRAAVFSTRGPRVLLGSWLLVIGVVRGSTVADFHRVEGCLSVVQVVIPEGEPWETIRQAHTRGERSEPSGAAT